MQSALWSAASYWGVSLAQSENPASQKKKRCVRPSLQPLAAVLAVVKISLVSIFSRSFEFLPKKNQVLWRGWDGRNPGKSTDSVPHRLSVRNIALLVQDTILLIVQDTIQDRTTLLRTQMYTIYAPHTDYHFCRDWWCDMQFGSTWTILRA